MFLKKLFNFKKDKSEEIQNWNNKLLEIVNLDKYRQINFPVLILSDVMWDFRVFEKPENLIDRSIFEHWGIDFTLNKTNNDEKIVIDSDGDIFKLDHNCYDSHSKIGFSYPTIKKEPITIDKLKARIIAGINEYLEVMDVKELDRFDKMKKTIQSLTSIRDLILYIGYTEF